MQPSPAQHVPQPRRYQTVEQAETGLPRIPKGEPWPVKFLYTHNYRAWEYHEAKDGRAAGFWPRLGQINCKPGANMVPDLPKGVPFTAAQLAGAIAIQAGKGTQTFLWGDPRLGQFAEYMSVWDVQGGGIYYKPWCASPELSPDGQSITWRRDDDQWWGFLDHLRENVLSPMTVETFNHLMRLEQRTLDQYSAGEGPNAEKKTKAQVERMDRMREAWTAHCKAVADANAKAQGSRPQPGKPRKGGDQS